MVATNPEARKARHIAIALPMSRRIRSLSGKCRGRSFAERQIAFGIR